MPLRRRGPRLAAAAAVAAAAVLALMVGFLTPWHPLSGATVHAARLTDYFTAAQIDRSQAYFEAVRWASWTNLVLGLVTAAVLGFTRVGRLVVAWVRRHLRIWWLQVIALVLVVVGVERLVTLPAAAWAHHVGRDYGLSTQSWAAWSLDVVKSLGISFGVSAVGMLALVGLARRFTRTWFIPASAGAAVLVLSVSFAYPVVFEPAFNSFTPLPDSPLRTRLLDLAARDGVQVSDVLVADASRRTTALNAYVSGFGSTKRIVIYDTLLDSTPDAQIELIVAHELGHATSDDVLVGTVEGALAAALALLLLYLALRPARLRAPVGAGSVGDPAIVLVVLGLVTVVGFAVLPVQNAVSRHVEARADAHSLGLTGRPRTFIELQQRLAVANLSHLTPNPVLAFWFDDHPSTLDRIGMGLAWERLHDEER